MKKILGVSLVALMAVSTARAEIASKAYVDTNFQGKALVTELSASSDDTHYPSAKAVYDATKDLATATNVVTKNDAITPGTATKITYDAKGLVTAGDDLAITDIPNGLVVGTAPISASRDSSTGVVTVSAAAATDNAAGVIKIASAEEITAGTSTTTAVTPAQLAAAKSAATYDDTALAGRVSTIEGSAAYTSGITSALVTQIGTNVTDIATLNGDASTSGSVAKSIADAINNLDLDNTYASAAQGALADTAVQPADIKTGTTNGTIKVGDTPVSVYGLDSAAYTASTDYLPAVASDSEGTDGTYVLTMKVSGNTQVLAWETIQR